MSGYHDGLSDTWSSFEVSDAARGVNVGGIGLPVLLRPRSDLFAAYQRSLSAEHQTVLARWARGDFQAGDEQLSAADIPIDDDAARRRPFLACTRFKLCNEAGQASEQAMQDVEDCGSESDDEQKASIELPSDK